MQVPSLLALAAAVTMSSPTAGLVVNERQDGAPRVVSLDLHRKAAVTHAAGWDRIGRLGRRGTTYASLENLVGDTCCTRLPSPAKLKLKHRLYIQTSGGLS